MNIENVETIKLVWNKKAGTYTKAKAGDPGPLAWKFIPGPIPVEALAKIYPLGKRALLLYLLLFVACRISRGRHRGWGVIPARELQRFNIDDANKGRIVAALEKAGLVQVKRQGHRSLRLRHAAKLRRDS
jgi:hypothetical protein